MSADDLSSVEAMHRYITATLGGDGGVNIELTKGHIDAALRAAAKVLTRYKPGVRAYVQPYVYGQSRYEADPVQCPGIINIETVQFVKPELTKGGFMLENPFRLDTVIGLGMGTVQLGYADFALGSARIKEGRRVFSVDPQYTSLWEVVQDPAFPNDPTKKIRVLAVYLDMPEPSLSLPYDVTVFYFHKWTATDDLYIGIPAMSPSHADWFSRYAVAKAKETLGLIRRKFQGVPGSEDGTTIQLDGAELVQEAKEEIAELEEVLMKSRGQIPPLLG